MKPEQLFREEVQKRKAYHLDAYSDLIKLNQNELPYDFPQNIKEKLFKNLKKLPFQRYPQTQPIRLKKALAKSLGVKPEQLIVSNGSNVMIQALVMATAIRGKVLLFEPTFGVYRSELELFENKIISIPLKSPDFQIPLEKTLQVIKKQSPALTFIANPNAPTGNLLERNSILEIIKASKNLVVVDEAYEAFSGVTFLKDLAKFKNLVLLRTFSKGFGMGGVRIGYMIGHPETIQQMEKVLLPYCVSSLSEEIALLALKDQKRYRTIIQEVVQEREKIYQVMRACSKIEVFPSSANFLLFKTSMPQECFDFLVSKKILIRDVSKGVRLENCLRVSVGTPQENQKFIRAIKAYSKL